MRMVCRIPAPCPDVQTGDIVVFLPVTDAGDEYTAGKRSTDLMEKYSGNCMTVRGVHYNNVLPIGCPHIYAEGV
jgi:hypothetical protein